jgi:Rnl2 family RNA ligase
MYRFLKKKRRYFMVFYTGNAPVGTTGQSIGYASLFKDGFLNQESLIKDIEKISGINSPVLTNFIEITESDYNEWLRKEKLNKMEFKKYNEIENSYRDAFMNRINTMIAEGHVENDFVVLEKVHGSNFSFWYDGETLKTGKKSGFVGGEGEDFFNSHIIKAKYTNNIKNLYEHFNLKFGKITNMTVYGELCGGYYPGVKSDDPSIKKVQSGIWYSPNLEFYAFDITVDGKYLNAADVSMLCRAFDIFHARILFRGKLEDCMKYPNEYNSLISGWLGLPEVEGGNICEGNIIKPNKTVFFHNGSRVIIKNKNDKWSEKEKPAGNKEKKERPNLSEAGNKVLEEALTYVTDNRLKNVLSKWEGPVTSKDFGRLMQLMNVDALEDLHKDFGPELLALEKECAWQEELAEIA